MLLRLFVQLVPAKLTLKHMKTSNQEQPSLTQISIVALFIQRHVSKNKC